MSVENRIRDYITENVLLGVGSELDPSQSLLGSGVMDSTGVLELVLFLEKTFHIEVADQDLVPENLDSLHNIAQFVARKRRPCSLDNASREAAS
jgi:acyl carrier protein